MATSMLEKEFEYYLEHQDEFISKYRGKVIVLKNQEVQGVYDSEIEAIQETAKKFPVGSFLVQRCSPGEESETYHSRVAFA